MSRWIIAIIVVSVIAGLGMASVFTVKSLNQAARLRWITTIAVFEFVVIAGLIAMWIITGMD